MQVILDSSFARPGSAPIWGGKKVEFRDWTTSDGKVKASAGYVDSIFEPVFNCNLNFQVKIC